MTKATIYHNPRCSKSRSTLAMLQDLELDLEVIEYLKTPPDEAELTNILSLLGLRPREFMRKKEAVYTEQNLDDTSLSDEQLISYIVQFPILFERPVVLANGKAAIGRPPELVNAIL